MFIKKLKVSREYKNYYLGICNAYFKINNFLKYHQYYIIIYRDIT